jgi:uncharacterized protein (UPF0276 family)
MSGAIHDRVGIGWRPQLAAGIFANLDRIGAVEVIADDYIDAGSGKIRSLKTLAAQMPLLLHGIGLGPASTVHVEQKRIDAVARVVHAAEPESWSEHLAFVRGGGIEIGHLCAPPRNGSTVDGAAANLDAIARIVGAVPHVENIATLIDPPGSDLSEMDWLRAVLDASPCPLLLDLHNVLTNSVNLGYDAYEFLGALPLDRVSTVHISGGRLLPEGRILDSHLHDPPGELFELLAEFARLAPRPLTVILERDGRYPSMAQLLAQLDQAREALARGRSLRAAAA